MRLALYEPDIPQNTGAMLRLAACLGVSVDVIEPCGFVWSDRHLRRAGMDYLEQVTMVRHRSWSVYRVARGAGRLILLTTAGDIPYVDFSFRADDTLLVGRETEGVPAAVHAAADARIVVPMVEGRRSLNVALAASMVLGEALRQTAGLPQKVRALAMSAR